MVRVVPHHVLHSWCSFVRKDSSSSEYWNRKRYKTAVDTDTPTSPPSTSYGLSTSTGEFALKKLFERA
ncbi:hypothetical protein AFLA_012077 [Aspergillus flavus NRRL3357]|nr:hypothetical protein AFLA_012077 [Aspergillus flavus NRRL3357]